MLVDSLGVVDVIVYVDHGKTGALDVGDMGVQHGSRVKVAEKKRFALLGVGGTLVADLWLLSLGLSRSESSSEKDYESKSHWGPQNHRCQRRLSAGRKIVCTVPV